MADPGDIVEGEITRVSSNNKRAAITVNSHEYLLIDNIPSVHDVGDPLTVRVLNSKWASKPSWRVGQIGDRRGYKSEFYTTVKRLTNRRNVLVEAHGDNPYAGETLCAGAVRCTVDAPVPVIPLSEDLSDDFRQVVVCTDPSLWDGDYFTRLSNVTDTTVTKLTNLKATLRNGDPITTTEILASELQEKDKLEIDASISHSPPKTELTADKAPVNKSEKQATAPTTEPETDPDTSGETTSKTPNIDEEEISSDKSSKPVPELDHTDTDAEYTETSKRKRDRSFTKDVRTAYNERCAVCDERRVTPDGKPEVEAAHIFPKKEGGVDEVQNGVALCKLHHWAFDSGWFSFTDDYKIIVRDTSDRDGYSEFIDLQGKSLHLPEQNRLCPNPKFIRSHRLLHGFEE